MNSIPAKETGENPMDLDGVLESRRLAGQAAEVSGKGWATSLLTGQGALGDDGGVDEKPPVMPWKVPESSLTRILLAIARGLVAMPLMGHVGWSVRFRIVLDHGHKGLFTGLINKPCRG